MSPAEVVALIREELGARQAALSAFVRGAWEHLVGVPERTPVEGADADALLGLLRDLLEVDGHDRERGSAKEKVLAAACPHTRRMAVAQGPRWTPEQDAERDALHARGLISLSGTYATESELCAWRAGVEVTVAPLLREAFVPVWAHHVLFMSTVLKVPEEVATGALRRCVEDPELREAVTAEMGREEGLPVLRGLLGAGS